MKQNKLKMNRINQIRYSNIFGWCRSFCCLDEVGVAHHWQFCCTTRTLIQHQQMDILQRRLPTLLSQMSKRRISSNIHLPWWPEKEWDVERNEQKEMQNTSGAMNAGVPICFVFLTVLAMFFDVPKSESFALTSSLSVEKDTRSKLSGFKSRWMMSFEWRNCVNDYCFSLKVEKRHTCIPLAQS